MEQYFKYFTLLQEHTFRKYKNLSEYRIFHQNIQLSSEREREREREREGGG